jgi:hypothetical protein
MQTIENLVNPIMGMGFKSVTFFCKDPAKLNGQGRFLSLPGEIVVTNSN